MILLTGFGPFSKISNNLSTEIVRKFKSEIHQHQIIKKILPVNWKQSLTLYKKIIIQLKNQIKLAILLGTHLKKSILLEKFGWNIAFGKDNNNKFKCGLIKYYLPFRIETILNLNQAYSKLKDRNNIHISIFPGLYLCNYIYYWALLLSKQEYPVIFIHIPQYMESDYCLKRIKDIIMIFLKM